MRLENQALAASDLEAQIDAYLRDNGLSGLWADA
jgi:hypothetical protein